MILKLDKVPFMTAIQIIKYCQSHGIDLERSQYYFDRLSSKASDIHNDKWELEVPEHLLTFFRMKYGGLE